MLYALPVSASSKQIHLLESALTAKGIAFYREGRKLAIDKESEADVNLLWAAYFPETGVRVPWNSRVMAGLAALALLVAVLAGNSWKQRTNRENSKGHVKATLSLLEAFALKGSVGRSDVEIAEYAVVALNSLPAAEGARLPSVSQTESWVSVSFTEGEHECNGALWVWKGVTHVEQVFCD